MIFKVDTATDPTLRLKLVTILVGLVDVIIGAVGSCGRTNDVYFLVTVLVIFSLSLLHLLCTILDIFKTNCTSRGMVRVAIILEDFIFHLIGGVLILVTSIILVSGTYPGSCGVMEKTSAADFIFHLIGGVLILVTSIILVSGTYPGSCGVMEKTSAATIGIFNSLIYLYICYLVLRLLRQKDSGSLLPMYLFCACSRSPIDFMEGDRDHKNSQKKHSSANPVSVIPTSRGQIFSAQKVHGPDNLTITRNSETTTVVQT